MFYWPYEETKLNFNEKNSELELRAPWLVAKGMVPESAHDKVKNAAQVSYGKNQLTFKDLLDIDDTLKPFKNFRLYYLLPRDQKLFDGLDKHNCIFVEDKNQMANLLKSNIASHWTNLDSLQIARVAFADHFDPITLFTLARRFHLLDSLEKNKTDGFYELIESQPQSNKENLSFLVAHNLFVTLECDRVLRPAINIAQNARKNVESFIKSEAGHHHILQKALDSMNTSLSDIEILDPLKKLLNLFEYAARKNLLAFSMIVDIFERDHHKKTHPLAQRLEAAGFNQAAAAINKHSHINECGNHANEALKFLESMNTVDLAYAQEAMRMTEVATKLTHELSEQMYGLISER